MKELNYKYQVIEEKLVGEKIFYKVKDAFEDSVAYVEKYKEATDMDWDESSKIEKELEEFKRDNKINEFFYASDYDKNIKIFYKVYKELENNPFDKAQDSPNPKLKEEKNKISEEKQNNENSTLETKENIIPSLDEVNKEINKEDKKKDVQIFNLQELGGKVKLNLEQDINKKTIDNNEDIFTSNLIPKEKDLELAPTLGTTENLNLDFKKSHSRASVNKKIICKRCEVEIESKYLNMEENIAYCTNCHSIREIKKLTKDDQAKKNINLLAPDGITVKNTSNMLHIETSLNLLSGVGLTLSGIGMIIFASIMTASDASVIVLIMYIISAIIGYKGFINIFNTIYIDVTKDNIKIISKPLMHFPEKNYSSKSISQLYVKEYIHRNKNSVSYTYKLRAILKNGKDISLLKLDNSQYVLYLERSIESWLQIEDRRVSGEYK